MDRTPVNRDRISEGVRRPKLDATRSWSPEGKGAAETCQRGPRSMVGPAGVGAERAGAFVGGVLVGTDLKSPPR